MPDDKEIVDSQDSSTENDDLSSIQNFEGEDKSDKSGSFEDKGDTRVPLQADKEGDDEKGEEIDEKAEEIDEDLEEIDAAPKVWSRPSTKELVKKFPTIFKDFPELKQIIFREQKFTENFATIDDAIEALNAKEELDVVTERIVTGNVAAMLEDIPAESLPKIAANILPALYKKSPELYYKIINPIVDNILKSAYKEGQSTDNKNLEFSAMHLSQWIFGDTDFATGLKNLPRLEFKEDPNLVEERKQFAFEKYSEARTAIVNHSLKQLEKEVNSQIPNDLNPKIKRFIIDEVLTEIDKNLNNDQNHLMFMRRLWQKAEKASFSGEHKVRIASAYLTRAKMLVPKLLEKSLAELRGEENGNQGDRSNQSRRKISVGGSSSGERRQQITSQNVNYPKSSDLDIIQGKAVLKGQK